MKTKRGTSYLPIMIIVFAIMLIPTLYAFLISIQNFKPVLGVLKSKFVGFKNYSMFFDSFVFKSSLTNTMSISAITLLVGSVYAFFASAAIGGIKNTWAKSLVAALFAVTAFLPTFMLHFAIPKEMMYAVTPAYHDYIGVANGLRLAGLVSLTAIFTKEDVLHQSFKTTFLFLVIGVVTFFTPHLSTILSIENPGIYEVTYTFPSYAYRTSFASMPNYSLSSAVELISKASQLILAVPMIFVMKHIMRKEKTVIPHQPNYGAFTVLAIVPLMIFCFTYIKGSSLLPLDATERLFNGYSNSFMISLMSGLSITLIAYALAVLARNSGTIGIVCVTLLCALSGNLIVDYIIIKDLGILNTFIGIALYNFKLIPMISMLIMFATKDNRSAKKDLAVCFIIAAAVFAMTWCDFFSDAIILSSPSKYSLSLLIRNVAVSNSYGAFSGPKTFIPGSTSLFMIIPILIVVASAIVVAFISNEQKSSEAGRNQQSLQ